MRKIIAYVAISVILAPVITACVASADVINPLDQFTATTVPITSITQRTYGKAIKITGLTNGNNLCLDSNGLVTTSGCTGGGGGTVTPATSTNPFIGSYFVATSTVSSLFPYASTTALSATTICLTGDTCITSWPAGSGGVTAVTGIYPIISSGGTTPIISIAFSTTTANIWSALQQFYGNASSTQTSVFNKLYVGATATTTINSVGDLLVAGSTTLQKFTSNNATTTNLYISGKVGIGSSTPATQLDVTGSVLVSNNVTAANFIDSSLSGTHCVSEVAGVLGTSNCVDSIASSANTITVSSPTGAVNIDLNLGSTNNWTALQQFYANASTSQLSVFNKAYFGSTATTTIDSLGNLQVIGSTTMQNFTASNGTTTAASSTNIFSTVGRFGTLALTNALTVANGGTGQNTLSSGQLLYGSGTNPVQSVATTTLTGTAPIVFSQAISVIGGSASIITCNVASGSQAGCLSSTDWSTFNSKLGSYDAFSHPASGGSATTSLMLLYGQASSTQLSVFSKAYFGATATTTINNVGDLMVIGTTTLQNFTGSNATTTNATTTSLYVSQPLNVAGSVTFTSTATTSITSGPLVIGSTSSRGALVVSLGTITALEYSPATSTNMIIDFASSTPSVSSNQVRIRLGLSATTITFANAKAGDAVRIWLCNPAGTAGAVTWGSPVIWNSAYTQTTTANHCELDSFNVSAATSTTATTVNYFGANTPF